jgi:hypothetical protein
VLGQNEHHGMMKGAVILTICGVVMGAYVFLLMALRGQLFTDEEINTLPFSRLLKKVG